MVVNKKTNFINIDFKPSRIASNYTRLSIVAVVTYDAQQVSGSEDDLNGEVTVKTMSGYSLTIPYTVDLIHGLVPLSFLFIPHVFSYPLPSLFLFSLSFLPPLPFTLHICLFHFIIVCCYSELEVKQKSLCIHTSELDVSSDLVRPLTLINTFTRPLVIYNITSPSKSGWLAVSYHILIIDCNLTNQVTLTYIYLCVYFLFSGCPYKSP